MQAWHNGIHNRICQSPMLPSRIAPADNGLLGLLDTGWAVAAFGPGSGAIRGRFWSHRGKGVPLGI